MATSVVVTNRPMKPYMAITWARARGRLVLHSRNLRWEKMSPAAPSTAETSGWPCAVRGCSRETARRNRSRARRSVTPAKIAAGMKIASTTGTGSILE